MTTPRLDNKIFLQVPVETGRPALVPFHRTFAADTENELALSLIELADRERITLPRIARPIRYVVKPWALDEGEKAPTTSTRVSEIDLITLARCVVDCDPLKITVSGTAPQELVDYHEWVARTADDTDTDTTAD